MAKIEFTSCVDELGIVVNDQWLTVVLRDLSPEARHAAVIRGLQEKLTDTVAGVKDAATIEARVRAVVDRLNAGGPWNAPRAAAERPPTKTVVGLMAALAVDRQAAEEIAARMAKATRTRTPTPA